MIRKHGDRKRPGGATAQAGTAEQAFSTEPMYLEAEVAEMLRVRLKVIQRERYAGRLGFVRVGAQVRIRHSDVESYIEQQSQGRVPRASAGPVSAADVSAPPQAAATSGPSGIELLDAARRGREIARSLGRPVRSKS